MNSPPLHLSLDADERPALSRALWLTLLLVCAGMHPATAQTIPGGEPTEVSVARPLDTPHGSVATSSFGSVLLVERAGVRLLVDDSGVGLYATPARYGRTIGFRQIHRRGLQSPADVDVATARLIQWPLGLCPDAGNHGPCPPGYPPPPGDALRLAHPSLECLGGVCCRSVPVQADPLYVHRRRSFGGARQGGYGFMWSGTWSPHSRMADYFRRHGLSAQQSEGTPCTTAFGEVSASYPLSMCAMLTEAGQLVLAHGIGAHPHTFIVNEPYGNKNAGYWNYQCKNVRCDWPGYNSGFQNLTGVARRIATRFPTEQPSDTLCDNPDFSGGLTMHTSSPASMSLWKDLNRGFAGHLWFATTREKAQDDVFICAVATIASRDRDLRGVCLYCPEQCHRRSMPRAPCRG